MDTKLRSWVKSIVWRVLGVVILAAIAWFTTENLKEMTVITVAFHGIRVFLYYVHERMWETIAWGRIRHPLAELPVTERLTPEARRAIEQKLRDLGYL